jgi:riboflavin synthase alpha subunit
MDGELGGHPVQQGWIDARAVIMQQEQVSEEQLGAVDALKKQLERAVTRI